MLVDNSIDGDSRVQKSARTAADAGWDVTLIGRAPGVKQDTSRLGNATLLRVPVPFTLDSRARTAPRRGVRHAFAYASKDIAAIRSAEVEWALLDLHTRRAAGETGLRLAGVWWSARRFVTRVRRRQLDRAGKFATRTGKRLPRARHGEARQWRWDHPRLADYELAFGPAIERLKPDLIHAHDFRMIGIAVRAADRLALTGRRPRVVYDAHEFLPGVGLGDPLVARGVESWERTYIQRVDAVITVCEPIADLLMKEHGLPERPTVVMNVPIVGPDGIHLPASDVRSDSGVAADVPLLVYVGVSAAKRGLDVMVDALAQLPDVHLTLVTRPNDFVTTLKSRAAELGAGKRLHVLPYVAPDDVAGYVRTATVGVHGMIDLPNHHLSMPTKLFEYAHGRIPVVTSDVATSAGLIRESGNGEVYPPGDVAGFVAATKLVLADPERYRAAYDRPGLLASWTWGTQAGAVDTMYRRLLGDGSDDASLAP
jgi:glycosyltransferase involved in cell wall biosynthesis